MIDIAHPAHVNFLKKTVYKLIENGNDVTVICIDRGKVFKILEKEFSGINIIVIGKHRGSRFSVIYDANIKRFFNILNFVRKQRFDIALGVGSFNMGTVANLLNIPNIQFDDDPERGLNTILEKLTATKLYFPPIIEKYGNVGNFNALKEWAYLSPKYFRPNVDILKKYNLKEKEYIFVREISTGSLNYSSQKSNIVASVSRKFSPDIRVIFSLENKKKLGYYPDNWQLLKEPVEDIHSIIYFSKAVVSSGDSMAREGSLLGVPSIYCGTREMKANRIMENKNILFHIKPEELPDFLSNVYFKDAYIVNQTDFRNSLMKEWVDVNDFIYESLMNLYYKKQ